MKTRQTIDAERSWLDRDFLESSGGGDIQRIKDLLEDDADIHAKNDCALRWAAGNGHLEVVGLLLDHGADTHAENDEDLFRASLDGHLEAARISPPISFKASSVYLERVRLEFFAINILYIIHE